MDTFPPPSAGAPPSSSSSSAERSLRLLSILANSGRPMSLADLVAALDLPKATVHRLCG